MNEIIDGKVCYNSCASLNRHIDATLLRILTTNRTVYSILAYTNNHVRVPALIPALIISGLIWHDCQRQMRMFNKPNDTAG